MADLDLSGRRVGEFVLHERIGAGGYGTVYRCEQPALKRAAVVKVLHSRRPRNNAAHQRFLREAQLASRLDHPYAAHVYSFGVEHDGLHWIAMELVHGVTLGEWLRSRGPMSLEVFVPFFECIAQVVQAAHDRGIVHRDLKPSNMMVIEGRGRLFPKLLDFGIAKLSDGTDASDDEDDPAELARHDVVATARIRVTPPRVSRTSTEDPIPTTRLTRPGVVLGSAPYMSPEQWGAPYAVSPATDIYSLGCVAYEALTGRAPFTAASTGEYYDHHLRTEPPSLGDTFSPSLDRVLQRALAKSPEARHASALELASELRAALRTEPREQLRSSAQQWHDRSRPPGLLWGRDVLTEVERWTRSSSSAVLSDLECSFVAASQRRARRVAWARRALVLIAALGAFGWLQYRSAMQARVAEQQTHLAEQQLRLAEEQARAARDVAKAKLTESELEQGRSALLHGEPEAAAHLAEAYKRDPTPATAFMLARSMQPRLAEQARFASTYGRMWWATFSPDGSQIATADDRAAQIWDGQTYGLLFTLPHGCEVRQAIYSADGAKLVTVAETMVRIWDARNGALLRDLKPAGGGASPDLYRAAISSDGRFIAAMDTGGSATHVWNAETGELVAELHNVQAGFPRLAFSRDGWLATTGGGDARVFDVRTWRPILTIRGAIRSVAFDTRSRLLIGSASGEVAVWAIPNGKRVRQLRQFGEPAEAVAFSPDGQLVAAGSRDGAMQIWHAGSGTLRSQLNPRRSKILWVEFDPTSTWLLAANADGTVVVADTAQGLPVAILDGPQNVVRVAQFDAGSRVVGASWDGTARIWDATPPYRRWSSAPVGDVCNIGMGTEPDRRFIAVGCRDLPTRVWDTSRDQLLAELPSATPVEIAGFTSAIPAVTSAGDLAAIAHGAAVQLYELPGGRLLRRVEHSAGVSAIAFADTGRAMVSGALDGSVRVLRDDGTELALQAPGGVNAVALLSDGRAIVSDAERHLRVHGSNGAVLTDLEMPVRTMSLRRDRTRLVVLPNCLSNPAPPLLIDLERNHVIAQLEGHVGCVFSARWVEGSRIVTAGADGTARLWDGATGRLLQVYRGGSRFLGDAVLISDTVIAGDADGLLRFWDVASGARLWMVPAHKSAVLGVHVEGGDIVTRGFTGEISRWMLPKPEGVIDACGRHAPCAIVRP
jgi:serine/threonine protein kinase/WD40 repeat protein